LSAMAISTFIVFARRTVDLSWREQMGRYALQV